MNIIFINSQNRAINQVADKSDSDENIINPCKMNEIFHISSILQDKNRIDSVEKDTRIDSVEKDTIALSLTDI